ncbi:glycosyltransferase [Nocardioides mesophilus]|uniref:Glycosyltransferase n=1 Tax=Nocardioides mesophilus TaxID=433659 RepID=A0A7G9REG0_9ACTN|nr:glycosyltransferase [Nocardioides mesophilus]QNN53985.1 glycosyltransferase [Nocardioides mesophilus]
MAHVAIIGTRGYPSYYGGFETAVRFLGEFLVEKDWDVTIYGRPESGEGNHKADPRIEVKFTRGWDKKATSTLSYGMTASIDAVRLKPDVALVMNVANGYWLPLLKARGIPTLVNVDGVEWERAKWNRAARAVFRVGGRLTARFADEIVVDAEAIGDRWQEWYGRPGVYIPYGSLEVPKRPAPFGLPQGSYVLFVARFVPENSVDEFFEASRKIARDVPVVIVGSSGYGGELDQAAAALTSEFDSVRWLGHVRDDNLLHDLWSNCGVYFHGHTVGGTNPALVQAMRCGAPVLARDTVFNREVLAETGHFVDSDPGVIADALRDLLAAPAEARCLGEAAALRAREKFDWPSICGDYKRALENLLE